MWARVQSRSGSSSPSVGNLVPAYNVIARMEGSQFPDEWVMRGNHRDAWVFGAGDPTSGMVALMEEARVVGQLAAQGYRPRRTLVYAGWDAEEPGLLGSTEWAEQHAEELRQKAVIYINTDSNGRGFLSAGGSHTLERLVSEVALAVPDPQTGVSVSERMRARARVGGSTEAGARKDLRIAPLGSGSDYTPFLQHLGIASLHIGFGGENRGGAYHSAFDSYDYYVRFGDPGFAYGIALAQVAGRLALRVANAEVLPLAFTNFVDNVSKFAAEVTDLAASMRQETDRHNRLVDDGAYALAADPRMVYVAPPKKKDVPHLNFAPLRNALERLAASARECDAAMATAMHAGTTSVEANAMLLKLERAMTRSEGLPGRPWFRHHIYAPGFYTGYGVKTLPAVREAIEARDWEEAERQVGITAAVLESVAHELDRIAGALR